MAFWFPVTAQYFQVPPQAHFEATSFAAPSQMQPFCFAPPGPVPYQMYTPMPMHYNSMHEMWMPMHSPADLACPRPLTPADRPLDRPTALHQNQDHSLATQRHRQGPYSAAHHPMTQPRGRQPGLSEQHNYTQSSNPKDKEAATASLAGPSTPSDTQRSRKQLDHLARCWSPASAATSSNQSTAASTSSNAFLTAASQHFHIPTSNLEAHPHSGTDTHADCQSATDQLSRMQLTDADASVSARQASRNGTADGAEQLGCETALMERSDASGSAWQGLTEGLLKDIMKLLPPHCNKRCRLVCRRWHDTLDSNLQELAPKHVQTHMFLKLFPAITALDLSGCQNLRNRNLAILSRSGLKISSLVIGHTDPISYGKPRITNQALQNIAAFSGLQKLVLADCSAVTTGGLDQLIGLTGLTHLALLRLVRVGHMGLTLLQALTCLTYLAFTGSSKVGDSAMQSVAAVPSLRQLVLGHTRVGDAGLALLGSLPDLTHLHLTREAITPAGLQALSIMTGLQSLGLSQCSSLSGQDVLSAVPHLTALTHLTLHALHLSTEHICALATSMPQLRALGIQGSSVFPPAMAALASLSALRCLSLSNTPTSSHSLTSITTLTQITSLQVQGVAPSLSFVQSLGHMPGLRGLDLHFYEDVGSHVLREAAVQHIGHCKNLAWLDISLWGMSEHQASRLIRQLPALQQICMCGCLMYPYASLDDRFPSVSFERTPLGSLWETHTSFM